MSGGTVELLFALALYQTIGLFCALDFVRNLATGEYREEVAFCFVIYIAFLSPLLWVLIRLDAYIDGYPEFEENPLFPREWIPGYKYRICTDLYIAQEKAKWRELWECEPPDGIVRAIKKKSRKKAEENVGWIFGIKRPKLRWLIPPSSALRWRL